MIEIAFRAQARIAEGDVVRVIDEHVIAIANAFSDGWSPLWPEGSRLALDLFASSWSRTGDLEAGFAHVRLEFPSEPRDDLAGEPGASLLAARVDGDCVDVVWIGPQHLVVVRDGVVVSRTQPDTLVEMGRAQGFDMKDSQHRHVLTRTIRRDDITEPHTARFALKKGDRVILASEAVDDAIGGQTAREILEKLPRDKFECVIVVT